MILLVAVPWLSPDFSPAQQTQQETWQETWTVPRTADGHPDLSGRYDTATLTPLYEYACHEANYSFAGILRGARLLEGEAMQKKSEQQQQ